MFHLHIYLVLHFMHPPVSTSTLPASASHPPCNYNIARNLLCVPQCLLAYHLRPGDAVCSDAKPWRDAYSCAEHGGVEGCRRSSNRSPLHPAVRPPVLGKE
jgi:hypothetical protein